MVVVLQLKPSIKVLYTKDIGFSTTYSYSDIFQAGLGGSVMKFDDGNLRKEANFWIESIHSNMTALDANQQFQSRLQQK